MDFFRKMNRKQRRQFDKLTQEEQDAIIEKEIKEKIIPTFSKDVSKSFLHGSMYTFHLIAEKYVDKFESAKYAEKIKVAKELIAELKLHDDKFKEMFPEDEESESEDNATD